MKEQAAKIARAYTEDADDDRPLGGYLQALATYGTAVAAASGLVRLTGRKLPQRVETRDLVLLALATQKTARTIAKDAVTSPIRAPFTKYEDSGAPGEVMEEVRGTGRQHTAGELLTCPFCLAQWVATGFAFGFVLAPRTTRFAATVMSLVGAADYLQFGYAALEKLAE